MKKTNLKKWLSGILCVVLFAGIVLCITGCGQQSKQEKKPESTTSESSSTGEAIQVGKGNTQFYFSVVSVDGKETLFNVNTNEKTVGEALIALNLIAGDASEYGLYVKTVNGVTLDYDKDGKYWAFYVNDAYATAGIDATDIEAGAHYALKAE